MQNCRALISTVCFLLVACQDLAFAGNDRDACFASMTGMSGDNLQIMLSVPDFEFTCIPLHINAEWFLTDRHINTESSHLEWTITFRVEETYPGGLLITNQPVYPFGTEPLTKTTIHGGFFYNPSESHSRTDIREVNASLVIRNQEAGKLKRVQSNTKALLAIDQEDHPGLLFVDSTLNPDVPRDVEIFLTQMEISEDVCAPGPEWECWSHLALLSERHLNLGEIFSQEDIEKVKAGATLRREIQIKMKIDANSMTREGKLILSLRRTNTEEPGRLVVSPSSQFKSRRSSNKEPYRPRSKSYLIKNTGEESLNYRITSSREWVISSVSSGKLASGQTKEVTIKLTESADKLEAPRQASVKFENVTNQLGSISQVAKLSESQKWQYSLFGHDTLFFGSGVLAGGVRVPWKTVVNFEIEDGRYKGGQGHTQLETTRQFSKPPGVFECSEYQGTYMNHKTPYVRLTSFPVPGSVNGKTVILDIPTNEYAIDYSCVTDTDALGSHIPDKWWREREIKAVRKSATLQDVMPIPSGRRSAPLKNGWTITGPEHGTINSIHYESAAINRID